MLAGLPQDMEDILTKFFVIPNLLRCSAVLWLVDNLQGISLFVVSLPS
jgi:hypothetical protein